jgi:hypothetical protein
MEHGRPEGTVAVPPMNEGVPVTEEVRTLEARLDPIFERSHHA